MCAEVTQLGEVPAAIWKQIRASSVLPEPALTAPEGSSYHSLPPGMLRVKGWGEAWFLSESICFGAKQWGTGEESSYISNKISVSGK